MGRHEEARAAACYAHELDPLDPMLLAMASQIAFQAGEYQDATARARQALAIDPEFWIGHMQLGQV
jgi:predicted Zn-dependent protease